MKYFCAAISGFFLMIQLTAAAPPFKDFCLFLDELSEINMRMGEALKRAKEIATVIQNNELKTSDDGRFFIQNTIDVVEEDYQRIASKISEQIKENDSDHRRLDEDTDQRQDANNVTQQILNWGAYDRDIQAKEPLSEGQTALEDANSEKSFVDDSLDRNDWTISNRENIVGTLEINETKQIEDTKLNTTNDDTNANSDPLDDDTHQQYEKELISEPTDIIRDQMDYNKQTNDVEHGQGVGAEKHYSGDEIEIDEVTEESGNWFQRATDSVVNWFD